MQLSCKSPSLVSWADGVMNLLVFGIREYHQVLKAIIKLIAVDVMNLLLGEKLAPKGQFNNSNVLSRASYPNLVYATVPLSQSVFGLSCRDFDLETVPVWVRIPIRFSRLAHLSFLPFWFFLPGKMGTFGSARKSERDQPVSHSVSVNTKKLCNFFKRHTGIRSGQPNRVIKLGVGIHGNTLPLYVKGGAE